MKYIICIIFIAFLSGCCYKEIKAPERPDKPLYGYQVVSIDSTSLKDNILIKVYFLDWEKYFILSERKEVQPEDYVDIEEGQILNTKLEPIEQPVILKYKLEIRNHYPEDYVHEHDLLFKNDTSVVQFYKSKDIIDRYVNKKVLKDDFYIEK